MGLRPGCPKALEGLIAGRTVTCRAQGLDDYGRILAVCTTPRGELDETIVRQGLAWAFVCYKDAYAEVEAAARAGRRGVLAAMTMPPCESGRSHGRGQPDPLTWIGSAVARSRETSLDPVNGSTPCPGRAPMPA